MKKKKKVRENTRGSLTAEQLAQAGGGSMWDSFFDYGGGGDSYGFESFNLDSGSGGYAAMQCSSDPGDGGVDNWLMW